MASSKIRVTLKAYDHALIDLACQKILNAARANGSSKISGPVPLPTQREVITVIRSPHKHKDSREQFESRTHKRLIDIHNPAQKVVDTLMKLELPAGVDIKVKLC